MPVPASHSPFALEASRPFPDRAGTLGALLRGPYAKLSRHLFERLTARGYPEIRPAHSAVLRHLLPEGIRLTELADMAGMTKQSMAYLVADLEALGHLQMKPDPADGRAKLVRLTAKGRKLMQTLLDTSAEIEALMATHVGLKEMKQLRRLLGALNQAADLLPQPDAE